MTDARRLREEKSPRDGEEFAETGLVRLGPGTGACGPGGRASRSRWQGGRYRDCEGGHVFSLRGRKAKSGGGRSERRKRRTIVALSSARNCRVL